MTLDFSSSVGAVFKGTLTYILSISFKRDKTHLHQKNPRNGGPVFFNPFSPKSAQKEN